MVVLIPVECVCHLVPTLVGFVGLHLVVVHSSYNASFEGW
jgi:hypothetical protein